MHLFVLLLRIRFDVHDYQRSSLAQLDETSPQAYGEGLSRLSQQHLQTNLIKRLGEEFPIYKSAFRPLKPPRRSYHSSSNNNELEEYAKQYEDFYSRRMCGSRGAGSSNSGMS